MINDSGGMSDRGYNSMTLEDASRISMVIGSVDSLDSVVRIPGTCNGGETSVATVVEDPSTPEECSENNPSQHG